MEHVRLGVIGAGVMGMKHMEMVQACGMCSLAGISDADLSRNAIADAFGVPFYQIAEALIEKAQPTGVIIATPNGYHAAIAEVCAKRSVHMLIEKPIADTLSQAMRIVDVANQYGSRVLVGHHRYCVS